MPPYRLMSLNTWFPAGDAFGEGYETFRRWHLGGRSLPVEIGIKVL